MSSPPPGWRLVRLLGVAAQRTEKVTPTKGDATPYVALEHLAQGRPILLGWSEAGSAASAKTPFRKGDVLFGKLRPNLRKAATAPFDGVCSTDILALYGRKDLSSDYLLHLLHWPPLQGHAVATASGTKMPRTSWALLGDVELSLPPLPEQRKIAAILSSVDDAIEKTQAVIGQIRVVKRGLMQELLTRGLPGHHKKFKKTEIGEIPEEWDVVALAAVCERITDGAHQSVTTSQSEEIPFLFVSCVRDGEILWRKAARISRKTYSVISKGREPRPGMVLYTAVGSYGHAALVTDDREFTFQRHIACLFPETSRVRPAFLVNWLNALAARKYADRVAVGNAQRTVTLENLAHFQIPLPSGEEQERIVALIDGVGLRINEECLVKECLLTVKQALMSVLVTGEVRVKPDPEAA